MQSNTTAPGHDLLPLGDALSPDQLVELVGLLARVAGLLLGWDCQERNQEALKGSSLKLEKRGRRKN